MRVVHLVARAGGMYCGACLHGSTLAAALAKAGHESLMLPLYTPVRTDEKGVSVDRVAYGGLNVYLQQRSAMFRHTPAIVDRLLDHPRLLHRLDRRSSAVRPELLGELTVSMLQGEEGRQRKELAKLIDWLGRDIRPELVHLSTVLLAGTAREITRQLGVPVVATLSGEDTFLECLPEPHYSQARAVLRDRCRDLAAMVALSRYYADFMAGYLSADRQRIHVIPPGLHLAGHGAPGDGGRGAGDGGRVKIGFLSRICPDKGLHELAEAFALLTEDQRRLSPATRHPPPTTHLPSLELRAAGYLAESDRPYLAEIEARLASRALGNHFQYVGSPERVEKIAFLQSLDVMCLPTALAESKGLAVLEAWANGVPVVVPAHGVFPELLEQTGGGLLFKPHDVAAMAEAIGHLVRDPALAAQCGRRAQEVVHQHYHADLMAQRTIALYESLQGFRADTARL